MGSNIRNSVLRYNGVDVPFIKTEKFVEEPIWSQDGVDLLYTHIIIGVSGILNACFLVDDVTHNAMDPADWIELNRPMLLQRGGQLYFFIGGTQVMPPALNVDTQPTTGKELVASPAYKNPRLNISDATAINAQLDARLGPKPVRLDIRQIRGSTYAIYYEIETWIPYCPNGGALSGILSNRWESTLDIDKDYFYTRTTNGVLVLNGQQLNFDGTNSPALSQAILDTAAPLIIPPLLPNWKREVVRMVLSSDNLTLTYSIQDRQQYVAVPRYCSHIDASYAEITPPSQIQQGTMPISLLTMMQVNMDITVYGDPSASIPESYPTVVGGVVSPDKLKWTLMKIMFEVIVSRINFPYLYDPGELGKADTNQNLQFITQFELREDVMKPIVGCRIVGLKTRPKTTDIFGASANWTGSIFKITMIGQPLKPDEMIDQLASQPISLGNYATFLFAQSVWPRDPCSLPTTPTRTSAFASPGTLVYTAQLCSAQFATGSTCALQASNDFSDASYKYPFTNYSAVINYDTDNHTIQLPTMYDVETGYGNGTTEPSSVFCQTASPTSKKVIHWKASRIGTWPDIPKPSNVDAYSGGALSDKLLNYSIQPGNVELSNDGKMRHYTIAGIYEIGMPRRVQWDVANTVLSTLMNPIIGSATYGDKDSSVPTSIFVNGIMGPP